MFSKARGAARGLLLLSSGQKRNLKVIWSLKNKENWKFSSLFVIRFLRIFFCVFQVSSYSLCFFRMYIDLGSIAMSAEIQNQQQPNSRRNERLRAFQAWFVDDLTFHSLPFAEAPNSPFVVDVQLVRERDCVVFVMLSRDGIVTELRPCCDFRKIYPP